MTGSVATGQRIATVAAPMMKHLHLELGGKDAFVLAPDATVPESVEALAYAALFNAGQVCTSAERVYAPAGMQDELIECLPSASPPSASVTRRATRSTWGPMAAERFRTKVADRVRQAVDRGATLVAGGRFPTAWTAATSMRRRCCPRRPQHGDHDRRDLWSRDPRDGLRPDRRRDRLGQRQHDGARRPLRSSDPVLIKRFFEEVKVGTVWINDPLTDNYAGRFGGM